jgi:putative hemolysin
MLRRCIVLAAFMSLTGGAVRDGFGDEKIGIANRASVYCVQSGYSLEIGTGINRGQYGVCLFPDGAECEEWAIFRNECGVGHRKMSDTQPEPIRGTPR